MLDHTQRLCLNAGIIRLPIMRYSISDLARKTGLSIHTLRFYEKEGILRYVERTASGRRVYGEASVACLIGALCLKQAKLTLSQIKEFFDMTKQGDETLLQRLEMLTTARENLEEMRTHINQCLDLVHFFESGGQNALAALETGGDADAAFPFLTLDGILSFPCKMTDDGKLEPVVPDEDVAARPKRKSAKKPKA